MKHILLINLLVISLVSHGQNIRLIKDIYPSSISSKPRVVATLQDGRVLLFADDGVHGNELWISDGTNSGTQIVIDINPGPNSGVDTMSSLAHDNKLFFSADDGVHGKEFWVSDGTPGGTVMLKDIITGSNNSVSKYSFGPEFHVYNNKVYFVSLDTLGGLALWVSDGTPSGTNKVKRIADYEIAMPRYFATGFGKLMFSADDGSTGIEWWETDGTASGTKLMADMCTGIDSGIYYSSMVMYNKKGYFKGVHKNSLGYKEYELMYTDGTAANTKLFKDVWSGSRASQPDILMTAINKLFFRAWTDVGTELWVSDGTPANTVLVKDIAVGLGSSYPILLGELNSKLLFTANYKNGRELYVSDGTEVGTDMLVDIYQGSGSGVKTLLSESFANPGIDIIENSYIYKGKYYFSGNNGTDGEQLWVTDGTSIGTRMIGKVGTTSNSVIDWIYVANDRVWVSLDDGVIGNELYIYDIPADTGSNIKELSFGNTVSINPNPNNGSFSVELNKSGFKNGYLKVTDINGRTIYDQSIAQGTQQLPVTLSNTPTGVYMVTVQLDGEVMTQSIVVQ